MKLIITLLLCLSAFASHASKPLYLLHKTPENRKYLVISVGGGLGNRLGAVASAYALARATKRTLVLSWDVAMNPGGREPTEMPARFGDLFTNPVFSYAELISEKADFLSDDVRRELVREIGRTGDKSLCALISECCGCSNVLGVDYDDKQLRTVVSRVIGSKKAVIYLHRYVRDFLGTALDQDRRASRYAMQLLEYYQEFFRILAPVAVVRDEVNHFYEAYRKSADSKELLVGVHYRGFSKDVGDLTPPPRITGYSQSDDFIAAMRSQIAYFAKFGYTVKFLVATDTPEIVKTFQKAIPTAVFLSFPHAEGDISRRDVRTQLRGLTDLLLLGKSHAILGTNQSSFSDLAAVMTSSGVKFAIGPQAFGPQARFTATAASESYKRYIRLRESTTAKETGAETKELKGDDSTAGEKRSTSSGIKDD